MAAEIREFAVRVPAGTPKAAPLVTDVSFPERTVAAVGWRVPPGPSGLMGWALTSAGAPVIPIQPGTYIVTDDQSGTWPLAGYLDSGNWQVTAYNTGTYDHTVYLTFELDLPAPATAPVTSPAGSGAGVIGTAGTVALPPPPPSSPPPPPPPPGDTGTPATASPAAMPGQPQAAAPG